MTPHAERFSKVCMGNYKDKKTFPCGRTGRGGGFGFEIIFKQSISQGEERHEKPTEILCSFFFFGLIEVVKMAFGIEGSLHGWNINYHVRNQV